MNKSVKLRIAIDCRIGDPMQGVGQAIIALASALSRSQNDEQDYTFVVREDVSEWVRPHVFGPCRLETVSSRRISRTTSFHRRVKSKIKALPGAKAVWKGIRPYTGRTISVPESDGFLESRFDIVHFPSQEGFLTRIPSIYQPWDLQHLHFPEFFSDADIEWREKTYSAFCRQAKFVCVQTYWGKKDLVEKLSVEPDKVEVIRWGSVLEEKLPPTITEVTAAIRRLRLPDCFFFYPAITWPHKNHEAIIYALRTLKDVHKVEARVCFSGKWNDFRRTLDRRAKQLGVEDQIQYLGFVSSEELQAIYARATAMIFPSKFEGFGLPILEAFQANVPVLSSDATVLPEVAQDGALYFDPDSPEQLAESMKTILESKLVRDDLIGKGKKVLSQYSMKKTARDFQLLYAKTARCSGSLAAGGNGR